MAAGAGAPGSNRRSLKVRLTGVLMGRQVVLLFLVATALFMQFVFFSLYGQVEIGDLMGPQVAIRDWFTVPLLVLGIYGGVLILGLAFAAGPSEQTFNLFLLSMVFATAVANYDHSILEWLFTIIPGISIVNQNPVSAIKVIFACAMFAAIAVMHYNILADDFVRRMLGRGVATDEVLPVRSHMMRLLLPILLTAGIVAVALALVGEFSQLVFQGHGLFPKAEIIVLGIFGVAIGALLLSIMRDFQARRRQGGTNR